tara:strand:+ start:520 stop:1878 length:1359 start_codon:yes stop_codon:yes gene_type:complete
MNSFEELCVKVAHKIDAKEQRIRSRTLEEQARFNYAVSYLLGDLWKKHFTHKDYHSSIQKNKNYYSALQVYRDTNLTYKMVIQAFDGLQKLNLIQVTKNGYYDRIKMEGSLTRFKSTDELSEIFTQLDGHPAITLKPNLNSNTIFLRNIIDGKRTLVSYSEDKDTEQWRENLKKINTCFSQHMIDLRIKDEEYQSLQERLLIDDDKEPIDLTQKVLVRIFINNSFAEGGRFYRGWWQNVPSEYRPYITINSKLTQEHDYSQLNPNMIYSLYNHELGSEDAYSRVLGPEHRETVKEAFNAMFQANTELKSKPSKLSLDEIGMSWKELREAILNAHKPIKDLFFTGLGNRLQFEDSIIAESIMLQFAKMDYPALPIHDSFLMHHAFGNSGELEEAMRRAFYERFNRDIGISRELVVTHSISEINKNEDMTDILSSAGPYYSYNKRNDLWLNRDK